MKYLKVLIFSSPLLPSFFAFIGDISQENLNEKTEFNWAILTIGILQ